MACHALAPLASELPRGVALRLVATSTGYAVFSADPGAAVPRMAWGLSEVPGGEESFHPVRGAESMGYLCTLQCAQAHSYGSGA